MFIEFTHCTFLDVTQSHEEALAQRDLSFQRAEERLQLVLRATKDGWWDLNLEIKRYYYSDRWWSMLGYDNQGFTIDSNLNKFYQLIHIDDRERVRKFYNEIDGYSKSSDFTSKISDDPSVQKSNDITYELEFSLRHKDGHYLPILSRGVIGYDASGKVVRISGVSTNLTERKKAEKTLIESVRLFKEIHDESPLAIFMYEDNSEEQTSLYINKTFVELFGYTLVDLPTVNDFWPRAYPDPEYRKKISEEWHKRVSAAVVTKTSIDPMENYVTCKDGSVKYISWGYVAQGDKNWGFGLDLTVHKQAEKDLKASEEKIRAIMEASPDGIGISSLDGIIEFVTLETQLMWGYSKDEFLGKHIFEVMTERAKAMVENTITELLKGNNLGAIEYEMVKTDGSHFICEVNCKLLYDTNQQPSSVLYIQRDVTERTLIAKELALAQLNAEQGSLAKSQLVSYMSHEFRTPLNVILGYAQLLAMDGELSADQHDYLSEIEKGGNHLRMLINDMLDMAKIEAGHVSLVNKFENIPTIIEECLGLSNALAKLKDISLHYQSTADINTFCDRTRLIQLLLNILSNAIKYNVIGGRVEITTELSDSNWYIISISDTGRGISADKLGAIFEPFNRLSTDTDTDTEGTGLGLTISRHLVELMGSTLGVNSEIGVGSHFWIKLPLIEDNNEHLPLSTATHFTTLDTDSYPLIPKSCNVLYVDDNASNLKLIEKQLSVYPFIEMTTLQSSTKTVAQVLAHRADVIILDINMPKMDGYQVLAALQADDRLKSIPVIALTANGMLDEQDRGLVAGFSFYLTKPVDKQALMDAINRCRTAQK